LAYALGMDAWFHVLRRDEQLARERADTVIALSTEQRFPYWAAYGTRVRGWALAEQGQVEDGIAQMLQGLAAFRAMGVETKRIMNLFRLAAAYGKVGRVEEGLSLLAEALAVVDKIGECFYEAELNRLKGELMLAQSGVRGPTSEVTNSPEPNACPEPSRRVRSLESKAEECFLKAIEVSRKQQAKSLELRATVSLARLWQQQGKRTEAHSLLFAIYGWFTEGFDTKDLQEAKALLDELT
jgi:predicted ATPase